MVDLFYSDPACAPISNRRQGSREEFTAARIPATHGRNDRDRRNVERLLEHVAQNQFHHLGDVGSVGVDPNTSSHPTRSETPRAFSAPSGNSIRGDFDEFRVGVERIRVGDRRVTSRINSLKTFGASPFFSLKAVLTDPRQRHSTSGMLS
jgi:hypothetical protein